MKHRTNVILVAIFVVAFLCTSVEAERWVCPAMTTRMESEGMVKIPILFGDQPAIDEFGLDLLYFDLRLHYEYVERSQLTQDWVALQGSIGIPCSVTIVGLHSEAIPAGVADTLCYVWFTVISDTEWTIGTCNFTDDLNGTECCWLEVIDNKQSTWGSIKSLLRE